jgi:hypothetical protein
MVSMRATKMERPIVRGTKKKWYTVVKANCILASPSAVILETSSNQAAGLVNSATIQEYHSPRYMSRREGNSI